MSIDCGAGRSRDHWRSLDVVLVEEESRRPFDWNLYDQLCKFKLPERGLFADRLFDYCDSGHCLLMDWVKYWGLHQESKFTLLLDDEMMLTTNQITANGMVAASFAIANIIGPQTFQAHDAPQYVKPSTPQTKQKLITCLTDTFPLRLQS